MGLRIATNTQSLAAQRQLGINHQAQNLSLEKISSGSRISRAADDAAGLAISENMRASIRSLRQGVRNGQDGISVIQTAEGGMNEVANILVRFRELSIQAASDTIGDNERGFIDKEVQALKGEIDRQANVTEFNGHKLLNGTGEQLEIQIGIHNNPGEDRFQFDTSKTNVTSANLGVDGISVASKESAQGGLDSIDKAITALSGNRAELGALQNRLQSSINAGNIYDENLSAARSRIFDVDMASETAELTKENILNQTGVAVLSQANSNNMLALKLMG